MKTSQIHPSTGQEHQSKMADEMERIKGFLKIVCIFSVTNILFNSNISRERNNICQMIINLLSSPRNISTAFMYSFASRSDMMVTDEPFYGCYLKESGAVHPGRDEIMNHMECDYESVFQLVEEAHNSNHHLFVKNMSHHIPEKYFDRLLNFRNIILLRDPKEMIFSFSKVIENPTLFDIGVKIQKEQFNFLISHKQSVVVIDSSQILKNPAEALSKLCQALNLSHSEQMLKWESGPKSYDGIWAKYWYDNVHNSIGFKLNQEKEEIVLKGHLEKLYLDAKPFYDSLYQHSIKTENHASKV